MEGKSSSLNACPPLRLICIACTDVLALNVEHDRHLKYIVRIRYSMHSDGIWSDVSVSVSLTSIPHPIRFAVRLMIVAIRR